MKTLYTKVFKIIVPLETQLPDVKYLSARSIRILIWARIILRIYMFLLGLYLIVNFASFIKDIFMK
jgi:hypothetical protein